MITQQPKEIVVWKPSLLLLFLLRPPNSGWNGLKAEYMSVSDFASLRALFDKFAML